MRKGLTITSMAGAVAMAMSGAAFAAGPTTNIQFGNTTTDASGNVSASYCATANISCQVVATGTGFAQIQVTDNTLATPETYIHTVVDDSTQGFLDETFVRVVISNGGTSTTNENGLLGQQTITQDGFGSTTNVNTGWANVATNDPTITIVQTLADAGTAQTGDEFDGFFGYKAVTDANGQRTSYAMDISQNAGLYQASTGNGVNGDVQSFALRERSGAFNGTTATAGNGAAITWSATDDVKAIWLGQDVALPETGQTNRADMARSYFGFVSYENVTATANGVDAGEYSSSSDIGGLFVDGPGADWNAVFNTNGVPGSNPNTPTLANP